MNHIKNSKGIKLDPAVLLSTDKKIDFSRLEAMEGRNIVSVDAFDRTTVLELSKFAALLELTEIAQHHPLDGKLVVTAFFEASTRTRLSFESAVLRLDGRVVSVSDGKTTGVAKGETLADIGEMFNTYGDLVVMRHPATSAIEEVCRNLELPLINAGNGSGEHPTQALLDWFTLLKWRPTLASDSCSEDQRIHIGIIGTPGSMRTVRSFLRLSLLFYPAVKQITIASEAADPLGAELSAEVEASPIDLRVVHDVDGLLGDFDVVYMNSIALLGDSYRALDAGFRLHKESPLSPGTIILHPFARRTELDVSLDHTDHNLYFAQAAGAVFIRQALMMCVLGRIDAIPAGVRLLAG